MDMTNLVQDIGIPVIVAALLYIGRKLIKDLGFGKVFDEHKRDFYACVDQDSPKQKYDVELAAIKSISILLNKPYMSFHKEFFYNNPNRNLQNTAPTLGVYVRDQYLAEHSTIED